MQFAFCEEIRCWEGLLSWFNYFRLRLSNAIDALFLNCHLVVSSINFLVLSLKPNDTDSLDFTLWFTPPSCFLTFLEKDLSPLILLGILVKVVNWILWRRRKYYFITRTHIWSFLFGDWNSVDQFPLFITYIAFFNIVLLSIASGSLSLLHFLCNYLFIEVHFILLFGRLICYLWLVYAINAE